MGNNDGRTKPPCRDGDKQQLSPVSVLDPHFDEEEEGEVVDRRGHDHHHPQLGLGEEQVVAEEGNEEDEVESAFQQSLAAVQRTKQVLLSRIRRLERLADLDPVELDRRLAEEARDGASCDGPESVERFEVEQVPVDGKEAALDVSRVNPPAALRRRSKEGVEGSNATIDMMVEMDVRREGDTWRRWPEEVRVVAAEAEAAVFALLVHEVAEELEGCTRTRTRTRTTA
uniref:UPF0102 protein Csac_2148 n=1 Tax=Anthurium amnicola TaxID=1678845 RepID=A0A1D1Y6A4_9ARAE